MAKLGESKPLTGEKDFSKRFPCLVAIVDQLEQKTDYEYFKLSLKFASDEELSRGTRTFFNKRMSKLVEEVDLELSEVLGEDWATMKKQNNGLIAIHTLLVLWRAVKDENFSSLAPEH